MADRHEHTDDEITCREFVAIVTDYLEGALPEERVDLIEEHLVMCDWCKTYLDQMQATVRALPDAALDEPASDAVRTDLMAMFADWKANR